MRWRDKLSALNDRHCEQTQEMQRRGYIHMSPLGYVAMKTRKQDEFVNSIEEQITLLENKECECDINAMRLWLREQINSEVL